jgi:hypothetical protein
MKDQDVSVVQSQEEMAPSFPSSLNIEPSVLPLLPSHICDMFTVKRLKHDNTTFLGELFVQPLLAALLQTTVGAQAPASTATETKRSGSGSNVI